MTSHGFVVRLSDLKKYVDESAELWSEFDRLQPGIYLKCRDRAMKALSWESRRALEKPRHDRDYEERRMARKAEEGLLQSLETLVEDVRGSEREAALRIADQALAASKRAHAARRIAFAVNYESTLRRCRAEQSDIVLQARQLTYRARQQLATDRLEGVALPASKARGLYESALEKWARAFAEIDGFGEDWNSRDDVTRIVREYQQELLRGTPLPADFPFRHLIGE